MSWWTPVEHPGTRSARAWMLDVGVLAGAGLLALPYLIRSDDIAQPRALAILGAGLLVAPLLTRRIWPVPTFMVISAVAVGFGFWDTRLVGNLALPIALYTVAAWGTRTQTYVCSAVLEALVLLAAIRLAGREALVPIVFFTGMVLAAAGLGLYSATRRAYVRELIERADRLERERLQADELAAATERARIAREMHDIVAHHLTVIVALSDAATRLLAEQPGPAADTVAAVSKVGREALADTRSLLGVLGQTVDPTLAGRHPAPRLGDLDQLVSQVREAGLTVEFSMRGNPDRLSAETELAIYRVVQEALTNTLKHAGTDASATVALAFSTDEVLVQVSDDGAGTQLTGTAETGRGTRGMRTRVRALGGQLELGPRAPTGWSVRARLPMPSRVVTGIGAEL